MDNREALQTALKFLLGSNNVYYQKPANVNMKYPAIVVELTSIDSLYATNIPYIQHRRYTITYIDKNPVSDMVSTLAELPKCSFSTEFKSDNLNHTVFTLYY